MKILGLFAWVLVPLSLWIGYGLYGTPHVALTYRFLDNGDIYNPRAARYYVRCDYYGWLGKITVAAEHGTCPWVRMFKAGR